MKSSRIAENNDLILTQCVYSLFFHALAIFLILSIPLNSGGASTERFKGFSIALITEEHTLKDQEPRTVESTEAATHSDMTGPDPGETEDREETMTPITISEAGLPSDQAGAKPGVPEVPAVDKPEVAAFSGMIPVHADTEGTEESTQASLSREDENADGQETPALMALADHPERAGVSLDTEVGLKEIPADKQPLAIARRSDDVPNENRKSLDDLPDQEPAQEGKSPSAASPQITKQGITIVEEAPVPSLYKEENEPGKEKAIVKTVIPTTHAADKHENQIRAKNDLASPSIIQNAQPVIAPARSVAEETMFSATEGETEMTLPLSEASSDTAVSAPVAEAAVQSIPDINKQSAPEKRAEENGVQKTASDNTTPSHDTPVKSPLDQRIAEHSRSLKTRPDNINAASMPISASEKSHDKPVPRSELAEISTKPASVSPLEPNATIEVNAKPSTSPGSPGLQSDALKGPASGKYVNRGTAAAPVTAAQSGEPKLLHENHKDGLGKGNEHMVAPSPEMTGKAPRIKGGGKEARGNAVVSAPATFEISSPSAFPDGHSLLSLPFPGMSESADFSAGQNTGFPGMGGQTTKVRLKPPTSAGENLKPGENTERLGMPLPEVLFFKDIEIEIYLRGGDTSAVYTSFTKKPYPVPSRRTVNNKEEAVDSTTDTDMRDSDEPGMKHTISVAKAEKKQYSFAIENRGTEMYEADVLFHLYKGREQARVKEYRKLQLAAGASCKFRFVMPDAIFWDDDVFSVVMEDSKYMTKVQDASGLIWKVEKEPIVPGQPGTPTSQPIPALLRLQ